MPCPTWTTTVTSRSPPPWGTSPCLTVLRTVYGPSKNISACLRPAYLIAKLPELWSDRGTDIAVTHLRGSYKIVIVLEMKVECFQWQMRCPWHWRHRGCVRGCWGEIFTPVFWITWVLYCQVGLGSPSSPPTSGRRVKRLSVFDSWFLRDMLGVLGHGRALGPLHGPSR